ncbi:hypothetical protein SR882_04625 [Guyparkeria halophila]|uniref:Uncharacterized protein n=1 Tax=Guyparkeria halophila TaxID=47960 RepID=A0ABZ0YZN3_9GAMM|nr:hypothetical protein [Guyparkeria halophila]WQH17193.1 hypothetical protein SR882_04625 [Guyparkeria halophila]
MAFFSTLRRTYRTSLLSSLVTLPFFVILLLKAIAPYSPAGVAGWLIIVLGIIGFEVMTMAMMLWVKDTPPREATPRWTLIAKIIGWAVPGVIIVTIGLMNLLDYLKGTVFVQG